MSLFYPVVIKNINSRLSKTQYCTDVKALSKHISISISISSFWGTQTDFQFYFSGFALYSLPSNDFLGIPIKASQSGAQKAFKPVWFNSLKDSCYSLETHHRRFFKRDFLSNNFLLIEVSLNVSTQFEHWNNNTILPLATFLYERAKALT